MQETIYKKAEEYNYNGKLYVINHAFLEGERIEVIKNTNTR